MLSVNIIGAGRVGKTFARLLVNNQVVKVQGVCNRSLQSARDAVGFIGQGYACELQSLPPADIILLSVSDDVVEPLARQLLQMHYLTEGVGLVHCSGALPSSVLKPEPTDAYQVASIHFVNSIADPTIAVSRFSGTLCAVEGDDDLVSELIAWSHAIDAVPFRLACEHKASYHAGIVMASNYLAGLLDMAASLCKRADVTDEQAHQLVVSIAQQALHNVAERGTVRGLTGPIARGDVATVQKHMIALQDTDELAGYRLLGLQTLQLARALGDAASDNLDSIETLLSAPPPN